ncbi:S8 family peptidase [Komagataeibacter nataicola]|uniref:Peptidase S8 n=1 Tax=Komagataeibacter nataicola TaxID=265960 RepID=A0ABX5P7G9_9PROT|nr:S8 family serine peptidase [Komagataeibacter nataicola]PYD65189.1 peptidase S8 [Komagataeibacter nataicola]WNM07536.1 S8 family serine peptidase [Komagataeibacter nataicola]GBR21937.1 subtilisin-like serine protease [Komagataeibacter nataicola NRIC 0616]
MRKYIILKKNPAAPKDGVRRMGIAQSRNSFFFERLTERAAASMLREPEVEAVAPAMKTRLIKPLDSADTNLTDSWGLDATKARTSAFTGVGVTVAVLDTGIDEKHPAFTGVRLIQKDFSGDGDGDVQGHGTHCAGTIFGRDVNGVRIGVAPGIQTALIGKVLGENGGDTEMLVQGVQWAVDNQANIISMSLGFDFPGMVAEWLDGGWPTELATSNGLEAYRLNLRVLDDLLALTRSRGALRGTGALVIAASGNESQRDQHEDWKIAASLPAAAEDVLSVAAVRRDGEYLKVADFSNSLALVSAPGVDIVSAKSGGGLEALSGTSMACPHVAGLAALWWEALKTKGLSASPATVRARLIATASREVFEHAGLEEDVGQGLVLAPTV